MASAARLAKLGHDVTLARALVRPRRRPAADQRRRLHVGRRRHHDPAAGRHPRPVPQVRSPARERARPPAARADPRAPVRGPHRRCACRAAPGPAQIAAFDELGAGAGDLGASWSAYVDAYSDTWEVLRRGYLEQAWDPALSPRELTDLLDSREMLHKRLRRVFKDERLRLVAEPPVRHRRPRPAQRAGLDGRDVLPRADLRRVDGAGWPGGDRDGAGRAARDPRGHRAERDTAGAGHRGRATVGWSAYAPPHGDLDADARGVRDRPASAAGAGAVRASGPCRRSRRSSPTSAWTATLPDLPHEVVLHGDPMLVVRTGGPAPDGAAAWTILGRGRLAEDVLRRPRAAQDRHPRRTSSAGSTGRRATSSTRGAARRSACCGRAAQTIRGRLGPTTPIPGVYAAGAHATPGSGLPFVGLSAALVAQAIGPADRSDRIGPDSDEQPGDGDGTRGPTSPPARAGRQVGRLERQRAPGHRPPDAPSTDGDAPRRARPRRGRRGGSACARASAYAASAAVARAAAVSRTSSETPSTTRASPTAAASSVEQVAGLVDGRRSGRPASGAPRSPAAGPRCRATATR